MDFYQDSKVPFNLYQDQGYYIVGEKKFLYKYNAFLESKKSKQNIKWLFNDEIFSTVDWTKKSYRTLLENYKLRAQQIRDKYDYLIISFSGGVDSTTMLEAFLNNNIKIDEIWCDWPVKLTEKSGAKIINDIHHSNFHSEFFLNTLPKLKKISSMYPDIKIHLSDEFSKIQVEDFEDTSYIFSVPMHMHGTSRIRYIYKYMHNLAQDTNKKIGLVVGCDKPNIFINKDNQIGMLFLDNAVTHKSDVTDYSSRFVEYFYWSPDMPQLVIDQCHAIIEYLQKNYTVFKSMEESMRTLKNTFQDRTMLYNRVTISVCYPNWDNSFQTNKPPFGRSNCFLPLLKPFENYDFVKFFNKRINEDYDKILEVNNKNYRDDSPTPLEVFFKFYPIYSINTIFKDFQ